MPVFSKKRFSEYSSLGSNCIADLNWEKLESLDDLLDGKEDTEAKEFLASYRQPHVLPQLMTLLGSPNFKLIRNSEGYISTINSLTEWSVAATEGRLKFLTGQILTKNALAGIFAFLRVAPRSIILPDRVKQISPEWLRFSGAVPLVLSAFKEYRNVKYSDWDFDTEDEIQRIGDILCDPNSMGVLEWLYSSIDIPKEDLLAYREIARLYKSGAKKDTKRTLNQTYSISSIPDAPKFNALPPYVRLLLCQTWLYQPGYYNPMMIVNLEEPDDKASPLVDSEVFINTNTTIVKRNRSF